MRGFLSMLLAVLVAIGAGIGIEAAVGSYESGIEQFAQQAGASLSSGRFVQFDVVLSASGPESTSNAFLRQDAGLSYGLDVSSSTSAPLSGDSADGEAVDFFVAGKGDHYLDLRLVDAKHLYVKADLGALAVVVPGLSASVKNELNGANPLLGGRWFELPQSVSNSIFKATSKSASSATQSGTTTAESERLTQLFESAVKDNGSVSMRSATGGQQDLHASVQLQGFLRQLFSAVFPVIKKSTGGLPGVGLPAIPSNVFSSVHGTFSGDLYADSADQLQRVATTYTSASLGLNVIVLVAHQAVPVGVPSGSVMLPQAFINAFRQSFKLPTFS